MWGAVYGAGVSFVATLLLFLGAPLLNDLVQLKKVDAPKQVSFEIKKTQKKKVSAKRPKPKPKKKPKAPPRPNLSSQLAGLSFGLPRFDFVNMDGAEGLLGSLNDTVFSAQMVDEPPKAKSRAPLQYPSSAQKAGIEGFVKVNILVGAEGQVLEARIIESQPQGIFDNVALASVKRWRYEPAMYKGQKVKVWANQVVRFDLD